MNSPFKELTIGKLNDCHFVDDVDRKLAEAVQSIRFESPNGTFAFEAQRRCDHLLVAESGDGHRAQWLVAADELPPSLSSPGMSSSRPA